MFAFSFRSIGQRHSVADDVIFTQFKILCVVDIVNMIPLRLIRTFYYYFFCVCVSVSVFWLSVVFWVSFIELRQHFMWIILLIWFYYITQFCACLGCLFQIFWGISHVFFALSSLQFCNFMFVCEFIDTAVTSIAITHFSLQPPAKLKHFCPFLPKIRRALNVEEMQRERGCMY